MRKHPAYRVEQGFSMWARDVLEKRVYAVLSTINPDGSTHSVPVGFAFDGEHLLIPSGEGSRKVRNVEADPRVRVLVQAPSETMGQDGWVAADGHAQIIRGAEAQDLNFFADGRYMSAAGKAAYRDAMAPITDLTIVVVPERWQTWTVAKMVRPLLEAGYTADEMAGWYLPVER